MNLISLSWVCLSASVNQKTFPFNKLLQHNNIFLTSSMNTLLMFSFTCRQPTKEALHEVTKGTFSDMNRNFSVNPPEKNMNC